MAAITFQMDWCHQLLFLLLLLLFCCCCSDLAGNRCFPSVTSRANRAPKPLVMHFTAARHGHETQSGRVMQKFAITNRIKLAGGYQWCIRGPGISTNLRLEETFNCSAH